MAEEFALNALFGGGGFKGETNGNLKIKLEWRCNISVFVILIGR